MAESRSEASIEDMVGPNLLSIVQLPFDNRAIAVLTRQGRFVEIMMPLGLKVWI